MNNDIDWNQFISKSGVCHIKFPVNKMSENLCYSRSTWLQRNFSRVLFNHDFFVRFPSFFDFIFFFSSWDYLKRFVFWRENCKIFHFPLSIVKFIKFRSKMTSKFISKMLMSSTWWFFQSMDIDASNYFQKEKKNPMMPKRLLPSLSFVRIHLKRWRWPAKANQVPDGIENDSKSHENEQQPKTTDDSANGDVVCLDGYSYSRCVAIFQNVGESKRKLKNVNDLKRVTQF